MFCRGTFTIDADGVYRALVTLVPAGHSGWDGHLPTRPGLRGIAGGRVPAHDPDADNPVAWLISRDRGATFTVQEAFPASAEARSPKYELPVSGVPWPGGRGILYFDRTSRLVPGASEDPGFQNRVYFCRETAW